MSDGVWIPADILTDDELTTGQKLVLARVVALSEKEGFCYAGDDFLADSLGLSKRQVRRHLGSLVDAGHLNRSTKNTRAGRRRRLTPTGRKCPVGGEGHRTEPSAAPDGSVRCYMKDRGKSESKEGARAGQGEPRGPAGAAPWEEDDQLPIPSLILRAVRTGNREQFDEMTEKARQELREEREAHG